MAEAPKTKLVLLPPRGDTPSDWTVCRFIDDRCSVKICQFSDSVGVNADVAHLSINLIRPIHAR
jgi:hypothetical protein